MNDEQPKTIIKNSMQRNTFLKFLLGFSLISTIASVVIPIFKYLIPPENSDPRGGGRVLVGTTSDVPIGQGKVVSLGNKPVIIANTDQGVKAFSAICTHLGCICIWDSGRNVILCPCHDGHFNPINGAVMSGPPPTPLQPIPVSVEGEEIYIGEA
jgi:Rieske Fe-S protein